MPVFRLSRHNFPVLFLTAACLFGGTAFSSLAQAQPTRVPQYVAPNATERVVAQADSESNSAESNGSDEKKSGSDAGQADDNLLEVKIEKLQILLEVDGIFQSTASREILLQPEVWSGFKIEQVAPHGSAVNAGDPLLTFDETDYDKELVNLQKSIESSQLTLQLAGDELRFLKESTAMDLEQSQRSAEIAAEDLNYYRDVREARDLLSANLALKMAEFRLEYASEELKQLTQMYEADDLTEQTEEIILKRTARDVEMAQHALEEAKLRHTRQIETLMPREKQGLIDTQARTALAKAKSVVSLPIALKKKELDFEQLKKDLSEKQERLQKLKADREWLTVTAPISGLVYYGQATVGKWSEITTREKQLRPQASAPTQQVLMTIVDPQKLEVLLGLSETQLAQIRDGQLAVIKPQSVLGERLRGRVNSISTVQQGDGKFAVTVELQQPEQPLPITPGMTCKTIIRIHENSEAILVPETAVFRDEFGDDLQPYVWLHQPDAAPVRQPVEVGFTKNGRIEILSGLEPGTQILKKAPTDSAQNAHASNASLPLY